MSFEYTVKKYAYKLPGDSNFTDLGHLREDGSEDNTEAQSITTSAGVELYAGTDDEIVLMVTDMEQFPDLETAMKDDSKQGNITLQATDMQDNTESDEGYSVIVQKTKNFSTGDRNAFLARFKKFHI